jgi:hypothetical protein
VQKRPQNGGVARWSDVEAADARFAALVRSIFSARRHHTIATLRRNGAPRISGIEVAFSEGDVVVGMMPHSRKQDDVRRDPRVAIHALSDDPPREDESRWDGDAKISGRVVERPLRPEDQPAGSRFVVDIEEVVVTRLDDPPIQLLIEFWHPRRGVEVRLRA